MSAFLNVENVSIDIPIFDASRSFRTALSNRLGGKIKTKNKRTFVRALDGISFSLREGDRLGLIGHNGAGKSTLLKTLGGIYLPHTGAIHSQGKIVPMFEISFGLNLEDTGFDNITGVGVYNGIPHSVIEERREEIIEFSELGDFIYLPIRTYSSGMLMRLSFSIVTTLLDPEILLLDEAVGAGDAVFAEKAQNRLKNFYNKLSILVMASHSNELIKKMCNKAILLEHGHILKQGSVDEVLKYYDQLNAEKIHAYVD